MRVLLTTAIFLPLLVAGCATPGFIKSDFYVDRQFTADNVSKSELDGIAKDIIKYGDGTVSIMVKYELLEPFASHQQLAETQGQDIQAYLVAQKVKLPFKILTTPIGGTTPNQIWISYLTRGKEKPKSAEPIHPPGQRMAVPANQAKPETLAKQLQDGYRDNPNFKIKKAVQ